MVMVKRFLFFLILLFFFLWIMVMEVQAVQVRGASQSAKESLPKVLGQSGQVVALNAGHHFLGEKK